MGEQDDKEKAERLAAARKRVAQLQKKKKAAGGEKGASASSKKSKDATEAADKEDTTDTHLSPAKAEADAAQDIDPTVEVKGADAVEESKGDTEAGDEDHADVAAFNEAFSAGSQPLQDDEGGQRDDSMSPRQTTASPIEEPSSARRHLGRQASVSLQSKMRSASFRQGATPASPAEEDDFPDIYRKQMARIEELENENKRLAKEAQESQARWQKNEDQLEELREQASEIQKPEDSDEVQKLKSEINSLRRNSRQSISVPKSRPDEEVETLRKDLEGKDSTISDMQLEISRLRSQVTSLTSSGKDENEQIAALQDSLQRSETSNTKLQTELADVKKALTRASEKAVLDGTERTSKDTKIRALERELEELKTGKDEVDKKAETLQRKIEALNKLHRESEQRNAPKLAAADATGKELAMVKAKVEAVEKENLRLREARKHTISGDGAEEGLDELEDEERQKLQQRIRELEAENFDLRRGVWRDKRKELQPNLSMEKDVGADADGFDEVDLNGSAGATRRSSTMHAPAMQSRHSGFTQVLSSGLAAFRTSTTSPDSQQKPQTRARNDSLLEEFDDEGFDENAFAAAQREEEMRKMVEHVREVKKGLKQWKGWRLDLVDLRRGGGSGMGFGEVFDV
ncbi:hypothetical protein LTR70_002268 [Exophiala xenobiotica]|uniref:M protein repeat protein n=1 Tax=Lithohypha guttulata TaxID=1690604 RepID=A0ABR0KMA1_9EURO|nr:hypothetical protein LTR24_001310 [Lithohypha guttulata]KAK5326003.1 hypothetical protein LTR70_002268 [Exophiala xenobiotica]